jgi:hypothetical protein
MARKASKSAKTSKSTVRRVTGVVTVEGAKSTKSKAASSRKVAAAPVVSVKLQFTRSGVPVGPPKVAPPPANDLRLVWRIPPGVIVQAFWTRNGQPIAPIPVPPGANDAHLKIG